MKNIIILICFILLLVSCNKPTQEKIDVVIADKQIIIDEPVLPIENERKETEEEKQRKAELREHLEKMTVLEIVDLYINEKKLFYINPNNEYRRISYFFISHDNVEWFYGTDGIKPYPYLYIIDEGNIRIEQFSCYFGPAIGVLGQNISVGKEYIIITKENLIDRYIGNNTSIENYTIIKSFKINKYLYEGLKGLFFTVLSDTIVYADGSLQGKRVSNIRKNSEVEVIDMFYNDLTDKYPTAVRIKTDNLTGWISVDSIDFIKNDKVLEGNNGIWLYNDVRKALEEYGKRKIKGKITGNSIPVRNAPSNNSEQLFLLPVNQRDSDIQYYIEEVSTNVDVVNGIKAAWYKVYKLVESDVEELGYEITGWVFGSYLSINESMEWR